MSNSKNLRNLAILALIGATLGYVFINVSIRLLGQGFQPITLTYLRFGAGFLLALLILGRKTSIKRLKKISAKDWLVLSLIGIVAYAASIYFFTLGVFHTKLVIVSVLSSTISFFTLFYTILFFRKLPKFAIIPFLFVSLFGVMVISTKSFVPIFDHFGIGEVYIILFAAVAGLYPIFRKMLSPNISNDEITLVIIPIALISLILFAISMHETITFKSFFHWQTVVGLFLGGFLNFSLTYAENFGFQHLDSIFGTQLLLTENIFAPIIGFLLFKELPSFIELVGGLLIIAGIYGVNKFSE